MANEQDQNELSAVVALNKMILEENAALRAGISAIHRRAQRSEGATQTLAAAKRGYEKEIAYQVEKRKKDDADWRELLESAEHEADVAIRTAVSLNALLHRLEDRTLFGRILDWFRGC